MVAAVSFLKKEKAGGAEREKVKRGPSSSASERKKRLLRHASSRYTSKTPQRMVYKLSPEGRDRKKDLGLYTQAK